MATVSPASVAQDQIKAFVERIERLEEERKAIAGDIAEVYAEAKGNGFDKKALKAVVRIRATDHSERMEHEALVELYMSALGMVAAPADDGEDEQPHVRARAPARESAPKSTEQPTAAAEVTTPERTPADRRGGPERPLAAVPPASATAVAKKVEQREQEASVELPVEPQSEPAEGATPTSAGHGDRGAVVPSAAPVVAEPNDYTKPNPWCLDHEECGLSSWDHFCLRCQRVKAERQAIEAVQ